MNLPEQNPIKRAGFNKVYITGLSYPVGGHNDNGYEHSRLSPLSLQGGACADVAIQKESGKVHQFT